PAPCRGLPAPGQAAGRLAGARGRLAHRPGVDTEASGGLANGRSPPRRLGSRPGGDRPSWGRAGPGQATPVPASGPLLPKGRATWTATSRPPPRPAPPPPSLLILDPPRRSPQVVGACRW